MIRCRSANREIIDKIENETSRGLPMIRLRLAKSFVVQYFCPRRGATDGF
jgi:hypothetical protein